MGRLTKRGRTICDSRLLQQPYATKEEECSVELQCFCLPHWD